MKKLLSIALSLCLLLSVALADVTLTKVYKTEDLVSNTFHNGFVTAIGMTGENTVVLKDDGTYEYTKRLMQTAEDGTVTAILPGDSDPTELGQLTLVNFANPAGLSAEGDNLYLETAASGQPTEGIPGEDGLGTLQDSALEGSNVDIVNEMVAMINVQRAYEMNAKMVSAADDMLQFISQTL